MKRPLMLLVALCAAQLVLAQPLQRKARQVSADEFTLQYSFRSDSLKGFFMLTEELTGKTQLLNAKCKWPYGFVNGRLLVGGEKIVPGLTIEFTFKMLEKNVRINGVFRSEDFGNTPYEKTFSEIRLERPEPLLAVEKQNPTLSERNQQPGEMYSKISGSTPSGDSNARAIESNKSELKEFWANGAKNKSETRSNDHKPGNLQTAGSLPSADIRRQQSAISHPPGSGIPDTIYPISFRVQLAASTTPMDKQKLSRLSGLGLPVYEDRIDNYYKYTIGNETSLKSAQALLNRVATANFKKPFIVAYRETNRVTVQEAVGQINRQP